MEITELLAKKNSLEGKLTDVIENYNKGIKLYKELDFKEAIIFFDKGLKILPNDGPCLTYINRCKTFIDTPPNKDWDGIFTFTEKG